MSLRVKTPEAILARSAVARALRRGDFHRLPCEVCGSPKSHAHHEDYSKPLEVRWLCEEHHIAAHREYPRINPERVREARYVAGLSQKELAESVGCSTRTIQQWEAEYGTSRPHPRLTRSLANVTGRPVTWFFEEGVAA
jgi:DNA-binding XRE family transcriptional regulator